MANARSFLFSFRFSSKVAYVLEFSHQKIRIYFYHRLLEESPFAVAGDDGNQPNIEVLGENDDNAEIMPMAVGAVKPSNEPLVIESPYTYNDLWDSEELCCKIQTIQHSDVLYIFSEAHPIMVLKRYSVFDWRLEELELKYGPFMNINPDDALVISTDSCVGTTNLTASGDIFSSEDVGRLLRLRIFDDKTLPWYSGQTVKKDDIRRSDGKYYRAGVAGTTGSTKPVHDEGVRSDGTVPWTYLHSGYGVVKITSVQDPKHAVAEVILRLPDGLQDGTFCWEMGLIHKGAKYPISGAFFRNRFSFLINTDEGPKVCLSFSGDYNNFSDLDGSEATDETAITVPVLNTEFNEGKWLYAGNVLFVGTGASEFYIDTVSSANALSNSNVKITQISSIGSKAIQPVGIGAHVFFADKYGLSLRDLMYNYYNEGYDQVDISLMGKHLFTSRIVSMRYQETPDKVLWCLMGDGTMTALTFSAEQEVAALSRHDFSGEVESIAVIPNIIDCCDEVWMEVNRFINGKNIRTVEFMESGMPKFFPTSVYAAKSRIERERLEADYVLKQALYMDGLVVFEREVGDKTEEISGLEHLEGMYVDLFADGVVLPKQKVLNGKISIKSTYVHVVVGLPIVSQFIPQHIFVQEQASSGLGQRQRIDHVLLMLYLSGGGEIGEDETSLSKIYYRPADGQMNAPQPLFSGIKEILFNGATAYAGNSMSLMLQTDTPLPLNVLALVPYVNI